MKPLKRLLPIFLLGCLLITGQCWAEGFIIYSIGGDAVYAIQPNDMKPMKLVKEADLARPSPDGRLLAVSRQAQTFDIVSIATSQIIKEIPLEAPLYIDFAWSPDRQWLAYAGDTGGRRSEIFLISVQSGAIRQLTFHRGRKRRLVWAPDSRSIFYGETGVDRSKFWEIDIERPEEPKEHDLFHEEARFLGPRGSFFSFSPKGDEIAYGSAADNGGVYIAKANGTNHRKLTPAVGSYRTYQVAWSPDGREIAFLSYYHETRTSVLYTISRHNRKIQRLVEIPIVGYGLAWVHSPVLAVEPAEKLTTTWSTIKQ